MISAAMREVVVLYGSREVAELCIDIRHYEKIRRSDALLKGEYKDALDYIADYATKSFQKSAFYRDNEEMIRKIFPKVLYATTQYLERKDIPLVNLWVGKSSFRAVRHNYVKAIDCDRVVDKRVVYGGIILYKVSDGRAMKAEMESLGRNIDPGQCVFARAYIVTSLYSLFERELRKIMGARSITLKTNDLWRMAAHSKIVAKIAEVFESADFADCIRKALIEAVK